MDRPCQETPRSSDICSPKDKCLAEFSGSVVTMTTTKRHATPFFPPQGRGGMARSFNGDDFEEVALNAEEKKRQEANCAVENELVISARDC
ncbi:hypothetical protein TNIN_30461 [Trichonephila inaurata madagascariensis]|uniref:Uncharacterized protein n=1 Tax=Trichonephila inaurata madagascariensis TaxID=2747483 RepID=A0A8X6YGJ5_9ARAC|nr:hypothetical protein TNIN_30461 [Trichonephila inaurata madagascariensis]